MVLAILQASITGAGLLLAVYALIIPISSKLFQSRIEAQSSAINDFKEKVKKVNVTTTSGEIEELKKNIEAITSTIGIPGYIRWGMTLAFIGYLVSALCSLWWLINWYQAFFDQWLHWIFGGSTFLFAAIGYVAIRDISSMLKKEFKTLISLRSSLDLRVYLFDPKAHRTNLTGDRLIAKDDRAYTMGDWVDDLVREDRVQQVVSIPLASGETFEDWLRKKGLRFIRRRPTKEELGI